MRVVAWMWTAKRWHSRKYSLTLINLSSGWLRAATCDRTRRSLVFLLVQPKREWKQQMTGLRYLPFFSIYVETRHPDDTNMSLCSSGGGCAFCWASAQKPSVPAGRDRSSSKQTVKEWFTSRQKENKTTKKKNTWRWNGRRKTPGMEKTWTKQTNKMWTWRLEKCSDGLRRKCGWVTSQMYLFIWMRRGLLGGCGGIFLFLVLLFVTPLKMYMGITSKLVNRKHPLAVCWGVRYIVRYECTRDMKHH